MTFQENVEHLVKIANDLKNGGYIVDFEQKITEAVTEMTEHAYVNGFIVGAGRREKLIIDTISKHLKTTWDSYKQRYLL